MQYLLNKLSRKCTQVTERGKLQVAYTPFTKVFRKLYNFNNFDQLILLGNLNAGVGNQIPQKATERKSKRKWTVASKFLWLSLPLRRQLPFFLFYRTCAGSVVSFLL